MGNPQRYWFKRRRYGWGWIPVTWQGWAVVLGYIAILVANISMFAPKSDDNFEAEGGVYMIVFIVTTILLIRISMSKGPTPKWRWGKKPDDNPDEDY